MSSVKYYCSPALGDYTFHVKRYERCFSTVAWNCGIIHNIGSKDPPSFYLHIHKDEDSKELELWLKLYYSQVRKLGN